MLLNNWTEKEETVMEKTDKYVSLAALMISTLLGLLAMLSANSGSCCMIYEPEMPKSLLKFKRF